MAVPVNVLEGGLIALTDGNVDQIVMSPDGVHLATIAIRYPGNNLITCVFRMYHLQQGNILVKQMVVPFDIDANQPRQDQRRPWASVFFTCNSQVVVLMTLRGLSPVAVHAWHANGNYPILRNIHAGTFINAVRVCPSTVDPTKVCLISRYPQDNGLAEYEVRAATIDWVTGDMAYDARAIMPQSRHRWGSYDLKIWFSPGDTHVAIEPFGGRLYVVRCSDGARVYMQFMGSCTWVPGDANTAIAASYADEDTELVRMSFGYRRQAPDSEEREMFFGQHDINVDMPDEVTHIASLSPYTVCVCSGETESMQGVYIVNHVLGQMMPLFTDAALAQVNAFPEEDSDHSMDMSDSDSDAAAAAAMSDDDGPVQPLLPVPIINNPAMPLNTNGMLWHMTDIARDGTIACARFDPPTNVLRIRIFRLQEMHRTARTVLPINQYVPDSDNDDDDM